MTSSHAITESIERNRREGLELIDMTRDAGRFDTRTTQTVTDTWAFLQQAKRLERRIKKAKRKGKTA